MSPRKLDPSVVEVRLTMMSGLLDDLAGVPDDVDLDILRNVLVHDYLEVDLTRVRAAIPLALDGYGRYVGQVAAFVADLEQS